METLVDLFGSLDQFCQSNEAFPSRLDATRCHDEIETGFHDVVGTTVAGNHRSRLAPPYGLLLPVAGEFVKSRFESALVYFLTRVCLLIVTAANAAVAGTPRWLLRNSRIVADRLKPSLFLAMR
jgi:hypothetical protein